MGEKTHARDITPRSVIAGGEAKLDGVVADHENDRDSRRRRLGRQCRVKRVRDDYADLAASQIGREP
jgi:hypothetical protein